MRRQPCGVKAFQLSVEVSTLLFETWTLSPRIKKEDTIARILLRIPVCCGKNMIGRLAELLSIQPPLTQRFVEAQARHLADAIVQRAQQVRFSLPDQVIGPGSDARPVTVSTGYREQVVGGTGFLDRFARTDARKAIAQRLQELELMSNREVSISARLLRHATVIYMVHGMLRRRAHGEICARGRRRDSHTPWAKFKRWVRPSRPRRMPLQRKALRMRSAVNYWCPILRQPAASICPNGWPLTRTTSCW